jgi:hypothetical protein
MTLTEQNLLKALREIRTALLSESPTADIVSHKSVKAARAIATDAIRKATQSPRDVIQAAD